jgi:hypothetical protein
LKSNSVKLTADECSNVTFKFSHVENGYRVSYGSGTHPVTGVPITVQKREPVFEDDMLNLNTEERNSRDSKRWSAGAGSDKGGNMPMIRVARTPLNKLIGDMQGRANDPEHTRWLLNSDAYAGFRTKTGKL